MMQGIHTDLALETREALCEEQGGDEIDGVEVTVEEDDSNGITMTWVSITNEHGAEVMGRPVGNYVTIESEAMKENETEAHEAIIRILADKLGKLHNLSPNSSVLVVGLGNWQVTPDALGPKTIEKLLVTRHMGEDTPTPLKGKVRSVSAIAPGVMGLTGIETMEIIKGVAEKIKPDLVIAIDALAARRTSRINATVQMTDTGVSPGAGMGNKRMPLNEETLHVPVIALGVPTVVDAATLVNDAMDRLLMAIQEAWHNRPGKRIKAIGAGVEDNDDLPMMNSPLNMLFDMTDDEKYNLIKEILHRSNMFVTPKEVDATVNRLANIIGNALNIALHPGVDKNDIGRYA